MISPFALFMVWAPLAVFLVWEVVSRSGAAYLAEAQPETAIHLTPANPTALLNLAEAELKRDQADHQSSGSVVPDSASQIRSRAELALRNDPLNARAFRILGQLGDRDSNKDETERFMAAAVRRSLHESAAVYWLMQKAYQDGHYRAALGYANTLLRTRTDADTYTMPILGKIAEKANGAGDLKQLLAGNPPWRVQFFDKVTSYISDARTPLEILLGLKDTPTPPTRAEVGKYLYFLVGHRIYDVAYYTWLQFLPPEQLSKVSRIFNGDFELAPSGMPFDWMIPQSPGVTVTIAERPDKNDDHALLLEFGGGRVDLLPIMQLVVLPPGQYRFEGKQKVDIVSQRGLQWRIICATEKRTQIAESPVAQGSYAEWQDFSLTFSVPENDCPAQYLQLIFNARWASEQFISGSVWYDDLGIVREHDTIQQTGEAPGDPQLISKSPMNP